MLQAQLEIPALRVQQVHKEHRALLAQVELTAIQGLPALQALPDRMAQRAPPGQPVRTAQQAPPGPLALAEVKALPV